MIGFAFSHSAPCWCSSWGCSWAGRLASFRPAPFMPAPATARAKSIVATGPVIVRYDEAAKGSDPARCRLPSRLQGRTAAGDGSHLPANDPATHIDRTVHRTRPGRRLQARPGHRARPRFLMTTGSLGPYNAGWAPLYVFETTTSQLGVYRMQIQQTTIGMPSRPRFELVELRSYARDRRSHDIGRDDEDRRRRLAAATAAHGPGRPCRAPPGAAAGTRVRRRPPRPSPPPRPLPRSRPSPSVRSRILVLDQPLRGGDRRPSPASAAPLCRRTPDRACRPEPSVVKTAPVSYWKKPSH